MASFRTHLTSGVVLGVAGIVGAVTLAFAPDSAGGLFAALFVAAIIGAILPDIDSDSGVPFHVTFGTLASVLGGLSLLYATRTFPGEYRTISLYVAGTMFLVWAVIGTIFKRFTRHRGMAHSIPAALVAGIVTMILSQEYGFGEEDAFLLALAVISGYLVHLILDEIYAAVNFHGLPFVPNKAFGSALKFFSGDMRANLLVYGSLSILLIGRWNEIRFLMEDFFIRVGK